MRRVWAILFLALLVGPACAPSHVDPGGPVDRVILVVEDRVSFEQLLSAPAFADLAGAGGVGLMTTYVGEATWSEELEGGPGHPGYFVIEWGTTSVPEGGGLPPLSRALASADVEVCSFFDPATTGRRGGPTNLFALPEDGGEIQRCPQGQAAARGRRLVVVDSGRTLSADAGEAAAASAADAAASVADALIDEQAMVRRAVEEAGRDRSVAVVVVSPNPSFDMARRGDEVTGLVLAIGQGERLTHPTGRPRALTSATTRRPGLVSNVDVAPTILDFFGVPIPSTMTGQPITFTDEAAPFALHRRHLDQRRIRIPVQMAELGLVAGVGLVGIPALVFLGRRGRLPRRLAAMLRIWALAAAALPIPLAAGGLLPSLGYAAVVPLVAGGVALLVLLSLWARRWGPLGPFFCLGAVGLGFVTADLATGGNGLAIPLLGGTMFDGVRYFGLPNAFIGQILAGALFLAVPLGPLPGLLLLLAAGVVAGFPALGANLGAAVTLFAAAGAWWVLRVRRRVGLAEIAVAVGMVAAGAAVVLVAHRYLAGSPTHLTRLPETQDGGVLDTLADRLAVGFRMLRDQPAAWIPVLGTPAVLAVVLARARPFGEGLVLVDRYWTETLVALTVAGVVAYLANDTGVAAVGITFMYALVGAAYPAFLVAAEATSDGEATSSGSLPALERRR